MPFKSFSQEFEQAYVPIGLDGITLILPIDVYPSKPVYFSVKNTSTHDFVAWSSESTADYYQVEAYINGEWRLVSNKVVGTSASFKVDSSREYRIRSCHKYGCSEWQLNNNKVSDELKINAFYTDKSTLKKGESTLLRWSVMGAATVEIRSSEGYTFSTLNPVSGRITIRPQRSSTFYITASGFSGEKKTLKVNVALEHGLIRHDGHKTAYTQPLYELPYDINHKTVLTDNEDIYFGTHDGKLLHYRYKKEAAGSEQWQLIWERTLNGIINNPPTLHNRELYYSVNIFGGRSQICSVKLQQLPTHNCTSIKYGEVYASPIVIDPDFLPQSNLSWLQKNGITPIDSQVMRGIYVFYRDGKIEVLSQLSKSTTSRQFTLPFHPANPILNTPQLLIGAPNTASEGKLQFTLIDGDRLVGLPVPVESQGNSIVERAQQMFRFSTQSVASESKAAQVQKLDEAWSADL
ncbi:hypothetical protein N483_14005 [Pseudoalteromonas luteoviolacea NCIMB 1944]|uniref:Uncharacterized protein n=2 Tax=Pseudoalteromonas luteoviolacea TaxID=43657 RepID=V4HRU4_PSEL2|nr:hypothetical protein PL2TA16_01748 [Pseudoalteromonas luteoviolacea 2ta16]KZN41780.1 hypothetical protein N483_14005 [Pseudoalteromonas luteoviolacea NCIMB 1944]